jgi:hypothetical protein
MIVLTAPNLSSARYLTNALVRTRRASASESARCTKRISLLFLPSHIESEGNVLDDPAYIERPDHSSISVRKTRRR